MTPTSKPRVFLKIKLICELKYGEIEEILVSFKNI